MERVLIFVPKATAIHCVIKDTCTVKVFIELTWHAHVHRSNPSGLSGGTHNVITSDLHWHRKSRQTLHGIWTVRCVIFFNSYSTFHQWPSGQFCPCVLARIRGLCAVGSTIRTHLEFRSWQLPTDKWTKLFLRWDPSISVDSTRLHGDYHICCRY